MNPTSKTVIAQVILIVCFMGAQPCVYAHAPYEPRSIVYDSGRLPHYSTAELIDLLCEASLKKNAHPTHGVYNALPPDRRQVPSPSGPNPRFFVKLDLDTHALDYTKPVEQELIGRQPVQDLLGVFDRTVDWIQQAWIADVLAQMRGPQSDSALRQFATTAKDAKTYFSLKYFALGCDSAALDILNRNYMQYPVPSIEWAAIVRSFGDCKYLPAVPNLVNSLTALMVDLGYAAHRSLLTMYPDARIEFNDPNHAKVEWKGYLAHSA